MCWSVVASTIYRDILKSMAPEVTLGGILAQSEASRARMPFLRGPHPQSLETRGAKCSGVISGPGAWGSDCPTHTKTGGERHKIGKTSHLQRWFIKRKFVLWSNEYFSLKSIDIFCLCFLYVLIWKIFSVFWNLYHIDLRSKDLWLFFLPNYCHFFLVLLLLFYLFLEIQNKQTHKNPQCSLSYMP